jgi:NADP-dependent 3-hydroxy acid dehydrogenase YdfG
MTTTFEPVFPFLRPFLRPEDIAHSVDSLVHQPMHVHVDDIRIRPTR